MTNHWVVSLLSTAVVLQMLTFATMNNKIRRVDYIISRENLLCTSEEYYDFDPDREPNTIRQVTCTSDPTKICRDAGIPGVYCCEGTKDNSLFNCVEMIENMYVYYNKTGNYRTFSVALGCFCSIENSALAGPLPSGPHARRKQDPVQHPHPYHTALID